jgi:hypothetical protein
MSMIDRLIAFLESKLLLLALVVVLIFGVFLAPVVLIDVEIYENREDGSMFYCATGTLTDPPFRHVGSGAVPDGDESYC